MEREALMEEIVERYGELHIRTTAEFYGDNSKGIWMSGEGVNAVEKDGNTILSYYAEGKKYELGVHVKFLKFLEKRGWFPEWYDCGTMMLYKD